jgi:hypothetical protein
MAHRPQDSVTQEVARAIRRRFWSQIRWFHRLRRWQRWVVRVSIALPLLVVALVVVFARTPVTRWTVIPALESALNMEVDAESVFVRVDGKVQMNRVVFHSPGVAGPAGEVLRVGVLVASVDWSRTLRGSPRIDQIDVDDAVIRVSQSLDDGTLNLDAFRTALSRGPSGGAPGGKGAGVPRRLPTVHADHAAIEIGEHRGPMYTSLKRLPVRGVLQPSPGGPAEGYIVSLQETPSGPGMDRAPVTLTGSVKGEDFNITLDRIGLDMWPPEAVPSPSREVFRDLGLQGAVDKLVVSYARGEGLSAQLVLDDVSMGLPFVPRDEGEEKPPRLEGVSGTITFKRESLEAKLTGKLEDLPYDVSLTYDGMSQDSAFTVTLVSRGFKVEKYPKLLPYATGQVRKMLAMFSGPTAVIDTRVTLTRARPVGGKAAPVEYQATMDVREASAAFEKFPYPFEHMSGHVYVDNNKIEFSDISGVSPSGAKLTAHGLVQPPTEDQQVDIYVQVRDAPADQYLEQAFGPKRQDVLDAILYKPKYQELRDLGLIITPGDKERLTQDLAAARLSGADPAVIADMERRLRAPVFELGGLIDIDLHVHRPPGSGVDWETGVDVHIARGGILPEKFPIPVIARDVEIKITEDTAEVVSGRFEGLRGGSGTVKASFMLPSSKAPNTPNRPEINIAASGVPLDDLLIHAIPVDPPRPGEKGLRGILTDLGLSGHGEARVRIAPLDLLGRPGALPAMHDETGFDANVRLTDGTSSPFGEGEVLTGLSGVLKVTEDDLHLRAAGTAPGGGRVDIAVASRFKEEGGPAVDTVVTAEELDTSLPVERVVRVFSEPAATDLAALRDLYKPQGRAASETRVAVRQGVTKNVIVTLSSLRDVAFDFFGGRVALGDAEGSVRVLPLRGPQVEYNGVKAAMTFNGAESGTVTINGSRKYRLAPGETGPSMNVEVTDARFGSPLIPAVLGPGVGAERMAVFSAMKPSGLFDASIGIAGVEPLTVAAFQGEIRPRSFAIDLAGERVSLPSFSGRVTFDGAAGRLDRVAGHNDVWQIAGDGTWRGRDGGLEMDLDLAASGAALSPDAAAVLPETLRLALAGILFKLEGPFELRDAHLRWLVGAGADKDNSAFRGVADFHDASLVAGVDVTGIDGRLDADFRQAPLPALPTFRVAVVADSLNIMRAPCTNARAVIQNGHTLGETLVPLISGESLGGRFAGNLRIMPIPGVLTREYTAEFQVAGVEFGPLLRAFVPPPPSPEPVPEIDRGRLDANFTVGGIVDQPNTRRGRGSARVAGKGVHVLDIPFIVSLIEVSNLQLPSGADLDYAQAMFYVDGPRMVFDNLSVYSSAVAVRGFGTMTWPEMEMNLRFDSSSARPLPIVSWVVKGIRDQLVTTRVTGTPGAPIIRVEAMPGTRGAFARALGVRGAGARELEEMERRAAATRRTIRPAAGAIAASPGDEEKEDAGSRKPP